jgi:recyclin-1
MKSVETSLIDFDELPLPSRAGAGGKQSGFFALTPSQTPGPKSNGTSSSSTSFTYGGPIGKFQPGQWYTTYKDHHVSLIPLCRHLQSSPSPSSTLALLFPPPSTMTLAQQSQTLLKLLLFLSPSLQPLRDWGFLRQALLAASDRFDSTCLVAFEMADSKGDTDGMRNAAQASWGVWEAGSGTREQWECGRVWVEKREVFYETSKWDSLENIVYVRTIRLVNVTDNISKVQTPQGATVKQLDFTPMDAFISHVLEAFRADAEIAAKVFPPSARVLLSFCDRVANDVVSSEGLTSAYARLANTSTLSCRRQE